MRRNVSETGQVVIFRLAEQNYGIEIGSVLEIIRPETVIPIPGSPSFVEGVIELRGQVIPVVDLARRFELRSMVAESARIIIVEAGDTTVGFIVDEVSEVRSYAFDQLRPPPEMVGKGAASYLKGIILDGKRLIILLDAREIFYGTEREALKKVAAGIDKEDMGNCAAG